MDGTLVTEDHASRMGRAEIDTSAPFESVKEAVDRFGGSGLWKPQHKGQSSFDSQNNDHCTEDLVALVVEETTQLEKDLMIKERETLEVLKELEMTKKILDGLKVELEKESSQAIILPQKALDSNKAGPITNIEEHFFRSPKNVSSITQAKPSPNLILMELKQAKLNLSRTTSDFASIRSSIEMQQVELEKEKVSIAKTCERFTSNSAKIRYLEKELSQTKLMLQLVEDSGYGNGFGNSPCISRKFHELRSETEQFKRRTAASSSEVSRITREIEQTKAGIKTAEVRVLAARKMEEAARASEVAAFTEIKSLKNSKNSAAVSRNCSGVTLQLEEYNMLVQKAKDAEKLSRERIEAAKFKVTEAHISKIELSKKVEEASAEVKNCRKALDEAVNRVEIANKEKLEVEEALRRWRSDQGQKRRSIHSSPRFKNPSANHHRKDSKTLDMRSESLITAGSKAVLKPTFSVGQILSRKLMGPDEIFVGKEKADSVSDRPKVSLGQMLSRRHYVSSSDNNGETHVPRRSFQAKKKRFRFVGSLPLILVNHSGKHNEKKKKQTRTPRK